MNEIVLALIQHLSWPLVVLVVFVLSREELRGVISRLRGFKAGNVELQLSDQLQAQGLPKQQLEKIASLSADELDLFLLVSFTDAPGFNYKVPLPAGVFKERLLQLQDVGLLRVENPEDPGENLIHEVTPLGRRVRGLLISSSAQLLRGAVQVRVSPNNSLHLTRGAGAPLAGELNVSLKMMNAILGKLLPHDGIQVH